MTLLLKLCKS